MFVSSILVGCVVLSVVVAAAEIPKHDPQAELPRSEVDAKITPSGLLLFRFKRAPQLNRAMTFTGFMPGGGMSAFSAAANAFRQPTWYSNPSGPAAPADTLAPPSGEADQPAVEEEPNWTKKPKKKPHHPTKYYPNQEEDEEEYEPVRGSKSKGGSATASFNAWFPIMFGGFPGSGSGYNRQAGESSRDSQPSRDSRPDSFSPYRSDFPGQTVIANSVSNGKGGVASSHAVAYGQRPEGRNYGYGNEEPAKVQPQQSYY